MKINSKRLFGAIAASLLLAPNAAYAVDPCEMNSSMNGGQRAQNGGTHNIAGGFNYEMWTNSGNNASMEYTSQEGQFQFKANWNNPDDLLCRIGLYWGTGPKPDELDGDLHCDFNYDMTGTGGGYNYIGIYGWTKVPNEVEYYIVENTFFGNTQKQHVCTMEQIRCLHIVLMERVLMICISVLVLMLLLSQVHLHSSRCLRLDRLHVSVDTSLSLNT